MHQLKLHEIFVTEDGSLFTTAMRVPGGWIYRSLDKSHNILSSSFVPYSSEYSPTTAADRQHLLWDRITQATDLFAKHSVLFPNAVIVGKDLLEGLPEKWTDDTYFYSKAGHLKVILVDGDAIVVVRQKE